MVLLLFTVILGIAATGPTTQEAGARDRELAALIAEMDALCKHRPVDVRLLDEIVVRADRDLPNTAHQGEIYYHAAYLLWATGGRAYDVGIRYAKRAMELPLRPAQESHVHIILGDLLQWNNRGATGTRLNDPRSQASTEYLKAMALVAAAREMNVPAMPDDPTDPDRAKEVISILEARRTKEDAKLKWDSARSQVVSLYSQPPLSTPELRDLALGVLRNAAEADALVKDVEANIGMRTARLADAVSEDGLPEAVGATSRGSEPSSPLHGPLSQVATSPQARHWYWVGAGAGLGALIMWRMMRARAGRGYGRGRS